jgi:chromosome segregation ATPase
MAERKDIPPLVAAAMALDDELRAFDDIAKQAKEQRMNSQKTLSRTAAVLNESVEARERIEAGVRRLVTEIGGAQERQQRSVQALVDVAAELERRSKAREELLTRFAGLGTSAAQVNALAAELAMKKAATKDGGATENEVLDLLREIQAQMTAVASEADALTEAAEKDGWPEIARQADAVRQQVNAVKTKVAAAHRSISAGAPS